MMTMASGAASSARRASSDGVNSIIGGRRFLPAVSRKRLRGCQGWHQPIIGAHFLRSRLYGAAHMQIVLRELRASDASAVRGVRAGTVASVVPNVHTDGARTRREDYDEV
jgi:hypothetical protein